MNVDNVFYSVFSVHKVNNHTLCGEVLNRRNFILVVKKTNT